MKQERDYFFIDTIVFGVFIRKSDETKHSVREKGID